MNVVEDTAIHMYIPSNDVQFLVGHIDRVEVINDDGNQAEVMVY